VKQANRRLGRRTGKEGLGCPFFDLPEGVAVQIDWVDEGSISKHFEHPCVCLVAARYTEVFAGLVSR
jgi:hypothetical protein